MSYPPLFVTKNSQGHKVVRLHYTADPEKATEKWIDEASAKYIGGRNSLLWRQEMEIDFHAGSGELVFPEFPSLEEELVVDPFFIDHTYKLYAGLDWGNRNPVSFHVYAEDLHKVITSVWEYYVPGKDTNVYDVSRIIKHVCPYYDRLEWIAHDPAMNAENQQRKEGNTSITRMFYEEVDAENRIEKLMSAHGRGDMLAVQFFKVLFRDRKFKFSRACPNQIDEFRNLKFPERKEYQNEPEKILDKDNHAWDDAKYFLLSHPTSKVLYEGPKFGTIGYYNRISEMAGEIAANSGRTTQEVFNDLYGKPI